MRGQLFVDAYAPTVVIDGHLCQDLSRLVGVVEELALYGDLDAVYSLVGFVNKHLSADGLAAVAGALALRLQKAARAAEEAL
jgi:hypothetical protein